MVEQRSPKPSVACSSRVSPAKEVLLGLLFSIQNKQKSLLLAIFERNEFGFDDNLCVAVLLTCFLTCAD